MDYRIKILDDLFSMVCKTNTGGKLSQLFRFLTYAGSCSCTSLYLLQFPLPRKRTCDVHANTDGSGDIYDMANILGDLCTLV